jgi:hypothetical protein
VITCRYHCSPCGRCFHSLDAFDAHHQRDEDGWPQCLDPLDLVDRGGRERLEALTEHGECRVYADVKRDVTIWIVAGSRERVARWREKASESAPQAA